jgi:hypothetical protein
MVMMEEVTTVVDLDATDLHTQLVVVVAAAVENVIGMFQV